MSHSVSAQSPLSFEIKSANLPLVMLRLKSGDVAVLEQELRQRLAEIPGFFEGEPLLLDFSSLDEHTVVALPGLLDLLRQQGLLPVAWRGGGAAQAEEARSAGLVHAPDARARADAAPSAAAPSSPAAQERGEVPAPVPTSALVIDRPLRSGQQVYARGRDLVVLAMVNPGAEVIADGNIHVYAPLRGKAIAGARGDADARIFSLSFEPELVSIAGVYRTAETPWPAEVWRKSAQVRLESGPQGDKLIMQALDMASRAA
jgi:septum site-determining protein MinC